VCQVVFQIIEQIRIASDGKHFRAASCRRYSKSLADPLRCPGDEQSQARDLASCHIVESMSG